jgi:hypothetical protein
MANIQHSTVRGGRGRAGVAGRQTAEVGDQLRRVADVEVRVDQAQVDAEGLDRGRAAFVDRSAMRDTDR